MVPEYLLINVGQSSGADRKSDGVTVTSSMPWHIGWVRNPTMPMSWNNGSQETITSPGLMLALSHIDSMFAHRFRWVISTAFGVDVEPEVSCSSAGASSSISTSGAGPTGFVHQLVDGERPHPGAVEHLDEVGERIAQHRGLGTDQRRAPRRCRPRRWPGSSARSAGAASSPTPRPARRPARPARPRTAWRPARRPRHRVGRRWRPAPAPRRRPRHAPGPRWCGRARAARRSSSRHRPARRCAGRR